MHYDSIQSFKIILYSKEKISIPIRSVVPTRTTFNKKSSQLPSSLHSGSSVDRQIVLFGGQTLRKNRKVLLATILDDEEIFYSHE